MSPILSFKNIPPPVGAVCVISIRFAVLCCALLCFAVCLCVLVLLWCNSATSKQGKGIGIDKIMT